MVHYDADTVLVRQNWTSDQFFTFRNLPGVKLQVYAGTTLTNPDGTTPDPFPLTGLRIPIDRVPDAMGKRNRLQLYETRHGRECSQ